MKIPVVQVKYAFIIYHRKYSNIDPKNDELQQGNKVIKNKNI